MTRTFAAMALSASLASMAVLAAQDAQAPSFRSTTDLVSVYATVTDKDGRLITDLSEQDFKVYDNGKQQPIKLFNNGLFPFSVVVMLDRSGSMADNFRLVREGAQAFVRQMREDDRARVGSFAQEVVITPEDFTSDRDQLENILMNGLQNIGPSPVWTAVDKSISALLTEPGRRVVLLFTDGHNTPARGLAITHLDDVVRRAQVDEIMVYTIGFANTYQTPAFAGGGPGGMPGGYPPPRYPMPPGPGGGAVLSAKRVEPPDPGLKDLADSTGGGYFEMDVKNDLVSIFTRIAEELHRQYWIGFAPSKLDGNSHKIEVKSSRPGLKIRARRSYVASKRG
jgi:Ca-activated chloride channel family protein